MFAKPLRRDEIVYAFTDRLFARVAEHFREFVVDVDYYVVVVVPYDRFRRAVEESFKIDRLDAKLRLSLSSSLWRAWSSS